MSSSTLSTRSGISRFLLLNRDSKCPLNTLDVQLGEGGIDTNISGVPVTELIHEFPFVGLHLGGLRVEKGVSW